MKYNFNIIISFLGKNLSAEYYMSKKSWPILYSKLILGQTDNTYKKVRYTQIQRIIMKYLDGKCFKFQCLAKRRGFLLPSTIISSHKNLHSLSWRQFRSTCIFPSVLFSLSLYLSLRLSIRLSLSFYISLTLSR